MRSISSRLICLGTALTLIAWSPLALAQEPGQKEASDAPSTVEEMTVTATKREENIQDVPIAISAFTSEDLERRGIQELENLQQIAPSLSIYSSSSTTNGGTIRIRGIGTTGNNAGLESAVGFFIDGIYRSRSGQAFGDLVDVERIEVLRGPQGTLFGKNTSAGAVHIITKKPEFEWGGGGSLSYGNIDTRKADVFLTGPIVDERLAFRATGSFAQRDGYYEDSFTSDEFGDQDRFTLKGQLLFTPTDNFDARIIMDRTKRDETCCPATYKFAGPAHAAVLGLGGAGAGPVADDNGNTLVGTNVDPVERVDDWGITGEMNLDLGWGQLTSITGWRDFDVNRGQDIDFSGADILQRPDTNESFRNFSQELRLVGELGELDWLLGGYAYNERLENSTDVRFATQGSAYLGAVGALGGGTIAAGDGVDTVTSQETNGWSLFTHNTYHLTDRLDLTGGYRWSTERKSGRLNVNGAPAGMIIDEAFCNTIAGGLANPVVNSLCQNASARSNRTEREYTGTVKLAFQATDAINTYVSYSRGYKAGGFNLDRNSNQEVGTYQNATAGAVTPVTAAGNFEFDPEFANAYELGMKGGFLDDRLQVNAAVFYTKFKDFQLNTFDGLSFSITNLPAASTRGVEVETQLAVSDNVFATLGGTYAIARYNNSKTVPFDATSGFLRGRRVTQSPRFQGAGGITIEQDVPGTDWTALASTNATYISERNTGSNLNANKAERPVWLANAQIGFRSPESQWEFVVWGKNITDKRYNTLVFDSVFQAGSFSTFVNEPRTYGVTINYDY